jgi:hypothetical protein
MWNSNKHRHRANNSVAVWNFKLNSFIGKQQSNVLLLVQKLKEKELVTWKLKSKELGQSGQKRGKANVKKER